MKNILTIKVVTRKIKMIKRSKKNIKKREITPDDKKNQYHNIS